MWVRREKRKCGRWALEIRWPHWQTLQRLCPESTTLPWPLKLPVRDFDCLYIFPPSATSVAVSVLVATFLRSLQTTSNRSLHNRTDSTTGFPCLTSVDLNVLSPTSHALIPAYQAKLEPGTNPHRFSKLTTVIECLVPQSSDSVALEGIHTTRLPNQSLGNVSLKTMYCIQKSRVVISNHKCSKLWQLISFRLQGTRSRLTICGIFHQ